MILLLLFYFVCFVCSAGMFFAGRMMRSHHAKAERLFFLMPRFASSYFRVVGVFFMVGGIIGMILYFAAFAVHLGGHS